MREPQTFLVLATTTWIVQLLVGQTHQFSSEDPQQQFRQNSQSLLYPDSNSYSNSNSNSGAIPRRSGRLAPPATPDSYQTPRLDNRISYPAQGLTRARGRNSGGAKNNNRRQKGNCATINIENGVTSIKQRGLLVQYFCSHGYELFGSEVAFCVRGQWSEPPPICTRAGCRPLFLPVGGHATSLLSNSVMEFSCNPGYRLEGSSIMYCNGVRWNDTEPHCIAVPPPTLSTPPSISTTTVLLPQSPLRPPPTTMPPKPPLNPETDTNPDPDNEIDVSWNIFKSLGNNSGSNLNNTGGNSAEESSSLLNTTTSTEGKDFATTTTTTTMPTTTTISPLTNTNSAASSPRIIATETTTTSTTTERIPNSIDIFPPSFQSNNNRIVSQIPQTVDEGSETSDRISINNTVVDESIQKVQILSNNITEITIPTPSSTSIATTMTTTTTTTTTTSRGPTILNTFTIRILPLPHETTATKPTTATTPWARQSSSSNITILSPYHSPPGGGGGGSRPSVPTINPLYIISMNRSRPVTVANCMSKSFVTPQCRMLLDSIRNRSNRLNSNRIGLYFGSTTTTTTPSPTPAIRISLDPVNFMNFTNNNNGGQNYPLVVNNATERGIRINQNYSTVSYLGGLRNFTRNNSSNRNYIINYMKNMKNKVKTVILNTTITLNSSTTFGSTASTTTTTTMTTPILFETVTGNNSSSSSLNGDADEGRREIEKIQEEKTKHELISPFTLDLNLNNNQNHKKVLEGNKYSQSDVEHGSINNVNNNNSSNMLVTSISVLVAVFLVGSFALFLMKCYRRYQGIARPGRGDMDGKNLSVHHDAEDDFVYFGNSQL